MTETWLLNETISFDCPRTNINFSSNNENFSTITCTNLGKFERYLHYETPSNSLTVCSEETTGIEWTDPAFRTLSFAKPPTGDLRTWLQANGNKQVSRKSYDLSTSAKWATLSSGNHNVQIVAKASGYRDSEPSAAVSVTKGAEEYTDCITFTGESSEFTLSIGTGGAKEWDGTIWYSTDHSTWTVWNGTTIRSSNKKLYLRGKNNTKFYTSKGARLSLSARAACSGNIQTLIEYSNPPTGVAKHCYRYMFYNCKSLTQAPTLPATTLSEWCYTFMFGSCTSLTQAPTLPATTLAKSCYSSMFYNCKSLTQAPTLPATTLANNCYSSMFDSCTSLTQAPELPITTLESFCYAGMFKGCTSLTQAPALPATTLKDYCYFDMFNGCTSLKISATQSAEYPTAWRIPPSGTISSEATNWNNHMLSGTGGTFTSNPSINTTYYGAWKQ